MTQSLGRIVLQRVAEHYKNHPESWCSGSGSGTLAITLSYEKVSTVAKRLCEPDQNGCAYTMIRAHSKIVAGDAWKKATKQAVRILCEHHKMRLGVFSIMLFNDLSCTSVQQMIDFIDDALGSPAKHVSMHMVKPEDAKHFEDA